MLTVVLAVTLGYVPVRAQQHRSFQRRNCRSLIPMISAAWPPPDLLPPSLARSLLVSS